MIIRMWGGVVLRRFRITLYGHRHMYRLHCGVTSRYMQNANRQERTNGKGGSLIVHKDNM